MSKLVALARADWREEDAAETAAREDWAEMEADVIAEFGLQNSVGT